MIKETTIGRNLEEEITKKDESLNLKEINVIDTSYENGSKWIEFMFNDGSISYEISENNEFIDTTDLEDKIELKDCSSIFAEILVNTRDTDNDMWFVESGEMSEEDVNIIFKDVEKFGLQEYVEFGDDPLITVYGGIITKIIYRIEEMYK